MNKNDDLIYRRDVIDVLATMQGLCTSKTALIQNSKIWQQIKDLPSAQRWFPVSERLPEEEKDVLITKEPFKINGYEEKVIKAKRSADPRSGKIEWWSPEFGTLTDKSVLAWVPLPEPWKGDNNEYTN